MSAFMNSFSAPRKLETLKKCLLLSDGRTALDDLLEDSVAGSATWAVDPSAQVGDTIFFFCLHGAVDRIRREIREAFAAGDEALAAYAGDQESNYGLAEDHILGIGVVAEAPYASEGEDGDEVWFAEIDDMIYLTEPLSDEEFGCCVPTPAREGFTRLTEQQEETLRRLIKKYNPAIRL